MADDLISETYLKITNWDAIPEKDEEFIKVFVTQMKWEFKGKRSKFNKLYHSKEAEILDGFQLEDKESTNDIFLNSEGINELTKDVVEELSHLGPEAVQKYIEVASFKESLPGWEKELFELHYEDSLSSRKIAKGLEDLYEFDVNYQNINKLINEVKTKLNDYNFKYPRWDVNSVMLDSKTIPINNIEDKDSLNDIYMAAENTDTETKDTLNGLSHLSIFDQETYIKVLEFKSLLPGFERELFDLYFEEGMSSRDIAKELCKSGFDIGYQTVNKLINQLKAKIEIWKQSTL
jgi:DNA-directed RNA polymerase specialized sigma subunit